ncbi:uncharacterized protein LOC135634352 [Musa acuminata AAA Group]|uniref:uncharacterized protein LOC135634352 n=1 Tax=Musa acuminata AAA Group TaxID=214697 RepID=UPI0031D3DB9E
MNRTSSFRVWNGSVSDHGRRHFYYFLYPLRSAQFRLASIIVLAWTLAYSTHAILNCFRLHLIWTQSYRQTIRLQPAILFIQSQNACQLHVALNGCVRFCFNGLPLLTSGDGEEEGRVRRERRTHCSFLPRGNFFHL